MELTAPIVPISIFNADDIVKEQFDPTEKQFPVPLKERVWDEPDVKE
jgi:hypothetical protein